MTWDSISGYPHHAVKAIAVGSIRLVGVRILGHVSASVLHSGIVWRSTAWKFMGLLITGLYNK